MIKISSSEYRRMKLLVEELEWVWQKFQTESPNDWYQFKYQTTISHFIDMRKDMELLSTVQRTYFTKKLKMPNSTYKELKEISDICEHMQKMMENPPYGGVEIPDSLLNKGAVLPVHR